MASSYSGTFTVDASSASFRVASKALLIIGDDDGARLRQWYCDPPSQDGSGLGEFSKHLFSGRRRYD